LKESAYRLCVIKQNQSGELLNWILQTDPIDSSLIIIRYTFCDKIGRIETQQIKISCPIPYLREFLLFSIKTQNTYFASIKRTLKGKKSPILEDIESFLIDNLNCLLLSADPSINLSKIQQLIDKNSVIDLFHQSKKLRKNIDDLVYQLYQVKRTEIDLNSSKEVIELIEYLKEYENDDFWALHLKKSFF